MKNLISIFFLIPFSYLPFSLRMLKCIYKADARAVPIYCPLNFTNVQTAGFINNVHARYVQAKRHYFGGADVAYALRNAAATSASARLSSIIDRIICCFYVLEAHMIPATSGWFVMLGVLLFQQFQPEIFEMDPFFANLLFLVKILSTVAGTPLLFCILTYEFLHRDLDRLLFKKDPTSPANRKLSNLLDYCWLPVSACLFMTIPSTEACIHKIIKSEEKYHVSEKILLEND